MDKAEFIKRLSHQFRGLINGAERRAAKEIQGNRGRMDAAGFNEWLKAEQAAALSEPALKVFDLVLAKSPETAAQNLAGLIDLDLDGNVNWGDQFKQAEPILANGQAENLKEWRYKTAFVQYIKSFKADARARTFSKVLDSILTRGRFIEFLESALLQVPSNIGAEIEKEFSEKRRQATSSGFLEYLKAEEQRILDSGESVGSLTAKEVAFSIAAEFDTSGNDWNATWAAVLNPTDMHRGVRAFHRQTWAQVRLWKVRRLLEALQMDHTTQAEPEAQGFFKDFAAMGKAFRVANECELTHADGSWCFVGEKTHAITIFWRAAIAAGLARADAPMLKVIPFLKDYFKLEKLGKNAIDKKRKIEEYDRRFQALYNELLFKMQK